MGKTKSRGNGQGCAYQHHGSWTACVVVGWRTPSDETKKPIPIKRTKGGFKTKKDAIAYCPTLLAGGVEKPKQAPRLSHYWKIYSDGELKKLSASKQTAYKIAWNKLKPIQELHTDCISIDTLRSTISEACPTYYPAKDCKSLLTNLFTLAGADGFANKDLPSYIVLPSLEEKERQPFSDVEQAALWKLYESGDRRAAIPLLMIYSGMMPGEAFGLRVENIDLEKRQILHSGLKTKVRKATPIVIASSIIPVVEDLIANAQPSGYIFKRVEKEWYDDYYAALKEAGCRKLTPYSCRHTTATALAINENIAPQIIKRVMRWSTTKMLDRYAHANNEDALSAVDTIRFTTDLLPTTDAKTPDTSA